MKIMTIFTTMIIIFITMMITHQEFACTLCDKTFPKEPRRDLHVKQHYYPFECSACSRFLSNMSYTYLFDMLSSKKNIILNHRPLKTETEVLKHEATHPELPRRSSNCPPTRL